MKRRAIIVGGSGFLGSHVAEELSNDGYEVVIIDKKKPFFLLEGQSYVKGNTASLVGLKKIIKKNDIIFYFAGIADIDEAVADPIRTIEENILNLSKFLKSISSKHIRKFIYASTMYVFNDKGSIYGASKHAAEKLILALAEIYKFKFTIIRYGSLYGPRSQEWNGLRSYVNQILSQKKIVYKGGGDEIREYIHVKDASLLSLRAIEKSFDNSALIVSGQKSITSKEVLKLIFETANLPNNVSFKKNSKKKYHYTISPYQVSVLPSKKLVPNQFIDLGEGIYELINEIQGKNAK